MKFKEGDAIEPVPYYNGFQKAVVTGVIERKGKQYYTLKIMCGTASILVSFADRNYKLKNNDK